MSGGRIIGVGQRYAGDDGVGLAVVAHLRARGVATVELREAGDPTELIGLLAHDGPVVIVDAIVGGRAGVVRQLELEAIDPLAPFAASSHGIGLVLAIELARTLDTAQFTPRLHIIGISINPPAQGGSGLSAAVAAVVPLAAVLALRLARRRDEREP